LRSFEFETWDDGRLTINRAFAELFRENRLATFDSLMHCEGGDVAKDLRPERITTRIELTDAQGGRHAFYIKRHGPSPWKEYVKPLLRLTWPILGAHNEWRAIIRFHEVGIRTMTPVALGQSGRYSFVISQAIEGCEKLSTWAQDRNRKTEQTSSCNPDLRTRTLIEHVAQIARTMHGAGMHHQDFYLTHLLIPEEGAAEFVYVIDLGRVCCRRQLSRRWIVKDLAQLDYSARFLSRSDRYRFLKSYLGRNLKAEDRKLVAGIRRKSRAIARHSQKNRL
jgi:heptose I phosphotransferase